MAVMEAPIPDESIYSYPVLNADPNQPAAWHFGFSRCPSPKTSSPVTNASSSRA
jgi:hypothetical protein